MTITDLVDRLAALRGLKGVPREQLQWLADHGTLRQFAAGEVVLRTTEPIYFLYVLLSGRISVTINRGAGPRKAVEWRAGDVTGALPFSRVSTALGIIAAEEPTEALGVHRDHFREMVRECYELTAVCVHVMLDRTRLFTSEDLHDEKMASLGRLSAGLAHELNNPASAVVRSAKSLAKSVVDLDAAAAELGAAGCSPGLLAIINRLRDAEALDAGRLMSALERAEHEEDVADWLARHHLDESQADVLASVRIDFDALDVLTAALDKATLPIAIRYITTARSVRQIAGEIETAASRIYGLVSAVKGFTHMDQASVPKPVDIGRGIADTLTVLRGKARAKAVELGLDIAPDLPSIDGFGGELNQVWSNLVDNAIDAAPKAGHVTVTAARDHEAVVVRVIDDGPGIPDDIKDRIFDPFFTTKGVGEGTGLGLDIARRLVERHDGSIDMRSGPGGTEFRVTLPLDRARPTAPGKGA
ncbi:MAG TPA: ATP-binding protein [Vicinamibacterales bacterium]|nr:ATP-binding protein [Vicinamibacterales bacterium]